MKFDVVAIGEAVVDFTPFGVSERGNIIYESQPGGAPCNMLAEVARLGGKAAFIGLLGKDPLGKNLIKVMKETGINVDGVSFIEEAPTGLTLVEFDEQGERSFHSIQKKKSYEQLTEADLDYNILDQAKVFYTGGAMFGQEKTYRAVKKAFEYVRGNGRTQTCCDLKWRSFQYDREYARSEILPFISEFDVLKLSEEELNLLSDMKDMESCVEYLYERGPSLIVVTLGRQGCYYYYAKGGGYIRTYQTEAVDSNAVGDTFTGAMLKKISELDTDICDLDKEEVIDMLDFANAAGAACVAKRGAMMATPTVDEVDRVRKQIPKYE